MTTSFKTYSVKAKEIKKEWRLIDATDQTLGRLASQVAQVLRGKDKPTFTTHMDVGDYVVIVNASKIRVTGNKLSDKMYYRHSMYPGGLRQTNLQTLLQKYPDRVIEEAVWGMLPHNTLGRALLGKMKVYGGDTHPHGAQIKEKAAPVVAGKPGKAKAAKAKKVTAGAAEVKATAAAPVNKEATEAPKEQNG